MTMNPLSRNMVQPMQGPRGTTPGQDLNALLAQMSMPGAPGTGLNSGLQVPALPSMQSGGPPTAQMGSQASKQKLANAMTQQAAGQLAQTGSPTGSAVGGAMQGANLAALLTGKSPTAGMGGKLKEWISPTKEMQSTPDQITRADTDFIAKMGQAPADPAGQTVTGPFGDQGPPLEGEGTLDAGTSMTSMTGEDQLAMAGETEIGTGTNDLSQFLSPEQFESTIPGADVLAGTTDAAAGTIGELGVESGGMIASDLLTGGAVETAAEIAPAVLAETVAPELAAEAALGSTGYGAPIAGAMLLAELLGIDLNPFG